MTDHELFLLLKQRFGAAKKANNNWVRVKCPTCAPRDAVKLKRGVNLKTLSTNCFICQKPLALSQIFGNVKIEAASNIIEEVKEHPQAKKWPCTGVIPVCALDKNHPAVKLLKKDHITDLTECWDEYGVGYITAEDAVDIVFDKGDDGQTKINSAHSLVFPVYYNNEFVGWQLRFVPGTPNGNRMGKMKYLHVFPKGQYLYNYDKAKEFNSVVVVEGVKKAWKFPNGVATFGKGITSQQIQLIQRWDEIILMYDAGDKTQAQARQLASQIRLNGKKCINIDPANYGFDSPDEMTKDEAQTIVYSEWIKAYD
jgi:CBS domain-containing protein